LGEVWKVGLDAHGLAVPWTLITTPMARVATTARIFKPCSLARSIAANALRNVLSFEV
jgi:hypothetical protein